MANNDTPPDGYIDNNDAPPDGYDTPTPGKDQLLSIVSDAAKKSLLDPLQAIKSHITNIGKGVEATASLPYRAAGAGIDAITGIPGFAKNVDVFPQLGAASPSFQTMAGNGLAAAGGELASQAIPAAIKGLINTGSNVAEAPGKAMNWINDLRNAGPMYDETVARAKSAVENATSAAKTAMENAAAQGQAQVTGATEAAKKAAEDAQAALGTTESYGSIGSTMRQGVQDSKAAMIEARNAAYKQVVHAPISVDAFQKSGMDILNDMKDMPEGFTLTGDIAKKVSTAANSTRPLPLKSVLQMQSQLGDIMTNGEGIEKLYAGKLYGAIQADLKVTESGPLGDLVAQHINDTVTNAKAYARTAMNIANDPLVKKLTTAPVENLPELIFKSGNVEDVMTARAVVGQKGFDLAKRAYTQDLLTAKNLTKALDKQTPEFWRAVYTTDQLNTIKAVAKLQDAIAPAKAAARQLEETTRLGTEEVLNLTKQGTSDAVAAAKLKAIKAGKTIGAFKTVTAGGLSGVLASWAMRKIFPQ